MAGRPQQDRPGPTVPIPVSPEGQPPDGEGIPGIGSLAPRVGETVESVVQAVREKTIVPAERAARGVGLVFIALVVVLVLVVLLAIGGMRWLTDLTALIGPGYEFVAYLGLGGILVIAGLFTWRLRTRR